MKDDDQTITELARMLADANRARRLAEDAARTPMLPLAEADRERDALRARLATVEREGLVQIEDLTKIIVERNEELTEVRTRLAQVERELAEARAEVEALTVDLARMSDEIADARRECHAALGRVAVVEDDLAARAAVVADAAAGAAARGCGRAARGE